MTRERALELINSHVALVVEIEVRNREMRDQMLKDFLVRMQVMRDDLAGEMV